MTTTENIVESGEPLLTCLENPSDHWPFGGIGQSGVHFQEENRSLSGYDRNMDARLHCLADGGTFIDSRAVPSAAFVKLVCSGPMLKLSLPPGTTERFQAHERLAVMAPALGGGFRTLAEMALVDRSWSGLDYVSLDIFVALYADAGARIGVRQGNKMRWREPDGTYTDADIVPCMCWLSVCLGCHRSRYYVDRERQSGYEIRTRVPSHPQDHCPECRSGRQETR